MASKGYFKQREEFIEYLVSLRTSGKLLLLGEEFSMELWFEEGLLCALDIEPKAIDERLGALLVKAEVISPSALIEVVELQERQAQPLGVLLCARNHLTQDALRAFLRKQYLSQLELLVTDFQPLEYLFDEDQAIVAAEPLMPQISLKDFAQHTQVWLETPLSPAQKASTLKQRQDLDAFLAASKVCPTTTKRSQKDTSRDWGNEIGACERAVYDLSTGEHGFDEICLRLGYSPRELRVALSRLMDANLVRWQKKVEFKIPASLVDELWRERKPFLAYRVLSFMLAFGFLGSIAYLSLGKSTLATSWFGASRERLAPRDSVKDEIAGWQMNKIRFALELYHAEDGVYPASLEALVLRGFLRFEDLAYPWQHHYAYIRSEDGYEVLKPIY